MVFEQIKKHMMNDKNAKLIDGSSAQVRAMAFALLTGYCDLYANDYQKAEYYKVLQNDKGYCYVDLDRLGRYTLVYSEKTPEMIKLAQNVQFELLTVGKCMLLEGDFDTLNYEFSEQYKLGKQMQAGTYKSGTLAKNQSEIIDFTKD